METLNVRCTSNDIWSGEHRLTLPAFDNKNQLICSSMFNEKYSQRLDPTRGLHTVASNATEHIKNGQLPRTLAILSTNFKFECDSTTPCNAGEYL